MDDYISRQRTKDYIKSQDSRLFIGLTIGEAVQMMIDEVPAADVKPVRWIPVEERLPEAGGTYLCVWQGKTVDTGFFCNGHFRLYGEIKDHLITHWMPLPELPSVNGKETEHDPEREG